MTASGSRIAEMTGRHTQRGRLAFCKGCNADWPCDASTLAAMLTPERLAAALGPHPQDPELRLARAAAILKELTDGSD